MRRAADRRVLLVPVLLCFALSSPASAAAPALLLDANDAATREPAFARYFDEQVHANPPTRPRLALDYPIEYGWRLLFDAGYLLTEPARWNSGDWLGFAGFAAATGGTMALDRTIDVYSRIDHPRSSGEKHFEDGVEHLGDFAGLAGVIGGSALFGFVADNDLAKDVAADSAESSLLSGVFTTFLKEAIGRGRPRGRDGPFHFRPFSGSASMPSGHATVAFALASTISERFDNRWWVAPEAYALATMVALARTRANAHFASDVLLGAAIGTATGRTVVNLERGREKAEAQSTSPHVSLSPEIGSRMVGLALHVVF